jgi:hypothetical protein
LKLTAARALQDLVFDNACLAHLRKHKAGQGMSAASNGVGHSLVLEQDPLAVDVQLAEHI